MVARKDDATPDPDAPAAFTPEQQAAIDAAVASAVAAAVDAAPSPAIDVEQLVASAVAAAVAAGRPDVPDLNAEGYPIPADHEKAPDLIVRGAGGWQFGMDVPKNPVRLSQLRHQITKGELVLVEGTIPDAAAGPAGDGMPDVTDGREVWAKYALAQGIDPGEVELSSRDDLVAMFIVEGNPNG